METLQSRRWFRKLCLFYKIVNNQSPSYLFDYIPSTDRIYNTRNAADVPWIKSKHNFFKNSYIPSTIIEWNKLDQDIRNAESYALFRKHLLSFIRPEANNIFNVHNAKGIKLLTRLRVGFNHLKEHKFQHNFVDAINPLCGNFGESTTHFFLLCTHFSNQMLTLINKIKDIDKRIFDKNNSLITQTLLFGDEKLSITDSKSILEVTIQFLISSGRFDSPLYWLLDVLPHWTVFTLELISSNWPPQLPCVSRITTSIFHCSIPRCVFLLWLDLTNKYRIYIFHFSPIWSGIYHMGSCTYCIFCLTCNSY